MYQPGNSRGDDSGAGFCAAAYFYVFPKLMLLVLVRVGAIYGSGELAKPEFRLPDSTESPKVVGKMQGFS